VIKELVTDTAVLSTKCEKATAEDAAIAADLVDTLQSLEDAACLAANQIGETKCIIAFKDDNDKIHVMYNPSIHQALRPSKLPEECLTLPEAGPQMVRRFDWVRIEFDQLVDGALVTKKRNYEGWTAEIIQHMIDHCNGKLI
jgi:peptide deformylase